MPPKAPGFARWSNACFVSGETSRIFASSTYPYRFLGRDAGKPLWCGAVKKRKLGICGGTVLCKPKNGSPFRNLNRRGGSLPRPPLVSVDSLSSLRPKGRSCHWQAGRFAPPLQESCMDWIKAGGLLASPPAKTSKENHTSYRDFSFLAAGDVFFHSPSNRPALFFFSSYSTVTDFARFRGLSTSRPWATAV